ncbi:MAG: HTH domain-containing protein, partial [Clostridia bacterium]|nr:HTH domain-containing protein [Clostridia bacterium]
MYDKLCVSERRTKMLEFLGYRRETTRYELAAEFHVSISTIHRD